VRRGAGERVEVVSEAEDSTDEGVVAMKKQSLQAGVLGLLSALLAGAALAQEIPADKEVLIFEGKMGKVTFLHKLHAGLTDVGGLAKVECSSCHHTYEGSGPIKPCEECHAKKEGELMENAPKIKDAYHLRCQGCHKYTMQEMGKHAGPVKKCKLCHVKEKKGDQ
jgi:hypothetical protein